MHLTSSRFYGGPERQMHGLAEALRPHVDTAFASFSETGLNKSFLELVATDGFTAISLRNDTPRLMAACREVADLIKQRKINVLFCHGYKAGLVGWFAARKAGIPVIAVSRGWTAENWKVRLYERLDRFMLRRMYRVVCVSRAQADKVRAAGVKPERIEVIYNAIDAERFLKVDPANRARLIDFFQIDQREGIRFVVGAAGRLSPEKGFDLLLEAAQQILAQRTDVGFVLFGEGPLRDALQSQIERLNIAERFVLAGFTTQLDQWMPHFDLFVQSSHSEGLPNVILESLAAGVPVAATDVGGTREIIDPELNCPLIPAGSVKELYSAILRAITKPLQCEQRLALRGHVAQRFDFAVQAARYKDLANGALGRKVNSAKPSAVVCCHKEKGNVVEKA